MVVYIEDVDGELMMDVAVVVGRRKGERIILYYYCRVQ